MCEKWLAGAACLVMSVGCSSGMSLGPVADAGAQADAGADAGTKSDAGSDAGVVADAGADGGSKSDAGADAGSDAGVGPGPDAGSSGDAGVNLVTGAYLLAFHACTPDASVDCNSPSNHTSYVAHGNDGVSWSVIPSWVPFSGSVPDVVRRGTTLYIYNPNTLHRYDMLTGAITGPASVSLSGGTDSAGYVDPSPLLEDGGIVMFYLPGIMGQDPAGCSLGPCNRAIHSATEVPGSDGTQFTQDPGDRSSIVLSTGQTYSDPDIFVGPSGFVLYVSAGSNVLVYRSVDGGLRSGYTLDGGPPAGYISSGAGGVPGGHYDMSGALYWTYVHASVAGQTVIRRATHAALVTTLDAGNFTTVLSGTNIGLPSTARVESPGFARNTP